MATIKGIKVGTTTITASYTDGGVTQSASVANFQVTAIAPTLTFTAASGTLTYDNTAKTLGTITYTGDGTAYYCLVKTTSTTQPSVPSSGDSGWKNINTLTNNEVKAIEAGYYHVFLKADAASGGNYSSVSPKYGNYKQITKPTVNVTTAPTFVSSTLTYNGSNQTLVNNNAACSPAAGGTFYYYVSTSSATPTFSTSTWSTTLPTGKNAGNYYVWYYCLVSDTDNYAVGTNANTVKALTDSKKTIDQKTATLSWGTTSWVYNKATHSTTASVSNLESGDTCTVTLSGNSVGPDVGSATVTATALSNANYKLPSATADKSTTISITQKTATLSWGTTSWVYNGSAHSTTCSVKNLESGDTCTVTLSGNSITNVGTTTVTATGLSNTNYALPSATADKSTTLTVTIRTVTITAPTFVTSTLTYNKSAQELIATNTGSCTTGGTMYYYVSTSSAAPSSFSTASGSGWSTTKPTGTNAGDYYVWYYCYVSDTANNTGTGINTITAVANNKKNIAQKQISLNWGTRSWTYDKATHSTTCTAGGVISGDTCTVTLSGNSVGPNVGSATVTATALSNNNYSLPALSARSTTISITAKTATLAWGTTSWVYNGSAHSTTCTVSNLLSGDTCTVTLSGNTITNVGSTTVTATELSNSNYVLPSATADKSTTLTVTIRTVEITAPTYNSDTLTYDKTEKQITEQDGSCTPGGTMYYYISTSSTKPTFSTASGSGWSTSYPKATNAGTYYVWYYCQVTDTTNNTGTGINTVTQISGTKVINQKTAALAWGTTSWVYNGSAHSTTCSVSNLVSGDSCTVTLSGNSVGPDIGSATVTATALSNSNYKLPTATADKSTTISITKADATLPSTIAGDSVSAGNVPYHNTARATVTKDYEGGTLQYSTDNGSTWNNVTWDTGNLTANPSRTALGTTTVKFRVSGDSNHNTVTSSSSVTLTVYAATDARMTVDLTNRTYTGNPQTLASVDTTLDETYHGVSSYSLGFGSSSSSAPSSAGSTDAPLQATNAGTYYVWYKYTKDANHGGTTTDWAYVGETQIAKADIPPVTVNMTGYKYGGTKNNPSLSATPVSGGTVTYYYNTTNSNSGGTAWSTVTSSTSLNVGTYYMYAVVGSTSNYNGYTTVTKSFTISKGDGVVTYSTSNPAAKYCITTANAADAAATDIEFTIATASASSSTNTGVTITYTISESGWSISSDGKKVTVPEDTPAGTYDITVTATAPATANYNQAQKDNSVRIVLTAVVLTGVTLTIPVNQIAYNAETTATLVATYNNGETKDVSADSNTTYSSSPTGIVTITK